MEGGLLHPSCQQLVNCTPGQPCMTSLLKRRPCKVSASRDLTRMSHHNIANAHSQYFHNVHRHRKPSLHANLFVDCSHLCLHSLVHQSPLSDLANFPVWKCSIKGGVLSTVFSAWLVHWSLRLQGLSMLPYCCTLSVVGQTQFVGPFLNR